MVDRCFEGYNATILAYGQTGSGKTYTMGTSDAFRSMPREQWGIVPRAIEHIFARIEAEKLKSASAEDNILVRVSYVEIIQERVRDLLAAQTEEDTTSKMGTRSKAKSVTEAPAIHIHDDGRGNVKVSGCRTITVRSAGLQEQLFRGSLSRTPAAL